MTLSFLAPVAASPPAVPAGENAAQKLARKSAPASHDMSVADNKALYCVGYAHLDTQWRWDFATTIDEYIRATLDDNFALFEKYPEYVFNFTGSVRYEMMKEYYPERYERLKGYIEEGRWIVSGSSVDEGDVNVPSPESIIRQVLYGNLYFKREFGQESYDFMLPDCFGFPASMPSIWAHCGLLGFSTQKLTWGSAVGIPFPVGVWIGPDGNGVIAALDPGPYVGAVEGRVDRDPAWLERVKRNGELYGVWADYHYYGVGDMGGAPKEADVRNYIASMKADDPAMKIILGSSDQLYRDITPKQRSQLPEYKGDMLLTQHSAGTLTSQSYMKRWNREAEQLADAAERAATIAWWLDVKPYPREKLERAWIRVLANQMHDILPGTSIPRAYRYSWNDDVISLNLFASVLTDAIGAIALVLDTDVSGTPLVLFNPLNIDRTEIIEAEVPLAGAEAVRVFDPDGEEVPSQLVGRGESSVRILLQANVPANGFAVYDVREADTPFDDGQGPHVTERTIENEHYRVTLNDAGDVAGIFDEAHQREMLAEPAGLVFTYEKPQNYPAWNMDWADRQKPPVARVEGKPQWRIVENGPVRAALSVTRQAWNSTFTQVYRLSRGDSGRVVECDATIDWQATECALKASFPLSVSNPDARYNWGLGTIARGNNEPTKYEVPSHEWFDLTDEDGEYGITILEDSKFGSDKPSDNELRLTLLYTPGVRGWYQDQHSQDWGVHRMRYGLYGHEGDWRRGLSEWRGRRFNQPVRAFVADKHGGPLGRRFSFLRVNSPQVDVRAIKLAEDRDAIMLRVQELWGREATKVETRFAGTLKKVTEVDGQERVLASLDTTESGLELDLAPFGIRTFAIGLSKPKLSAQIPSPATPIDLPFDTDVVSLDGDRDDGSMDPTGRSYAGEVWPTELHDQRVPFTLGGVDAGEKQAVSCRGQEILLGDVNGDQIHMLAAATEDLEAVFKVGAESHRLDLQSWTGFVGQWYDRVWDRDFGKVEFEAAGEVRAILPGYIKRDPIAWFSTHRHHPQRGNEAYQFTYLYHYVLPRTDPGATTLTLPYDERIRVMALTIAEGSNAVPAAPLYDELEGGKPIAIRHDYETAGIAVFADCQPVGKVRIDREPAWTDLSIGAPRADDDIDQAHSARFVIRYHDIDGESAPHHGSGAAGDRLGRLNDGDYARNDDDTDRCVWFDSEGRFSLDMHEPRDIERVNTYSWHRSNRAPQFFSLWGATGDDMPSADIAPGKTGDWQLIAVVDTRHLRDGEIHASSVTGSDGTIGPYRYLLWITEDVGQGTFFTEIDIDLAESTQ